MLSYKLPSKQEGGTEFTIMLRIDPASRFVHWIHKSPYCSML